MVLYYSELEVNIYFQLDYNSDTEKFMTRHSFLKFSPLQNNISQINSNTVYSTKNVINFNNKNIDIMNILQNGQNQPISINNLKSQFPNYEDSKFANKSFGIIRSYAANTYQGIIRY
jgi:hypothetical protein